MAVAKPIISIRKHHLNDAVLAALMLNRVVSKTCILHHEDDFRRLGDAVRMIDGSVIQVDKEIRSEQVSMAGAAAGVAVALSVHLRGKRKPKAFFGTFTRLKRGDWRYACGWIK